MTQIHTFFSQEKIYKIVRFIFALATTAVFTINLLYHIEIANLAPWQLIIIGTCLETTIFLFEIPTGIIADKFSRKISVVIGFFLIGIGFIVEGSFPKFIFIALAQIIWGIGYTCISGALDAWVIDETGREELFISGGKIASVGEFTGIVLGVAIAQISLNAPILIGGFLLVLLSFFVLIFMSEKPFKKNIEAEHKNHFINVTKSIFNFVKTGRVVAIMFIIALFVGLYSEGFDRLWGKYIVEIDTFSKFNTTYLFGLIAFITATLKFFVFNKIDHVTENTQLKNISSSLTIFSFIIMVLLVAISFVVNGYMLVLFIILINLFRGISEPLQTIWFNKLITNSENRATFLSLRGQVDSCGQIGSGLLMSSISFMLPLKMIFLSCAVVFSPVVFLYYYLTQKNEGGS